MCPALGQRAGSQGPQAAEAAMEVKAETAAAAKAAAAFRGEVFCPMGSATEAATAPGLKGALEED